MGRPDIAREDVYTAAIDGKADGIDGFEMLRTTALFIIIVDLFKVLSIN
jgi:hypothetical protein